MSLSRVPSFSQRPDFPKGLKVMVVDPDSESLKITTAQLLDCNYEVSSCANEEDATLALEKCEGAIDVLLCQTSVVSRQTSTLTAFLEKIRDLPLVLMGENCTQQQKITGVKLGAVDFLEKPLSELKLRNIWQHTVRKMLRAQKQPAKCVKVCKEEVVEIDQPAHSVPAENAGAACSVGVTTRLHRARQQESTGSSEAIESSGDAAKECTVEAPSQSVGVVARKAESRRKVGAVSSPVPVPTQQPQSMAPPMPNAAISQYHMQGMPAPLPGCVWGLPMLPPPVPGLMSAPPQWPSPTSLMFNMQQQAQMQMQQAAAAAPAGKAAPMMMSASSATACSQQPVYSMQQCWQPASAPAASMLTQPPATRAPPQMLVSQQLPGQSPSLSVKAEAACAQHTSTTGSNSNSEATWQALDWGMDDMFFDDADPALEPKLDLNNILNGGLDELDATVEGGLPEDSAKGRPAKNGFELALEPCETWLDDHSMLEDDFDASLAGLNYFEGSDLHDELGLTLNKSPSLIDMIDHLCAHEAA